MSEILPYFVGVFVGSVVVFFAIGVSFFKFKSRSEKKRSEKARSEDEDFLENLPRRSFPNARVQIGRNEGAYDSSGNLVWDSVRGCVGPASRV